MNGGHSISHRRQRVPLLARRLLRGRDNANFYRLLKEGRIEIGYATYAVPPRVLDYPHDQTRLIVGKYSSMAGGTSFVLGGNHPMDRVTTYPLRIFFGLPGRGADGYPQSKGDIIVGSDVWIGHAVTVLSGVTIGDGAVVAAGSVVTSNVPPYAIVAGNPAQVRRYRFAPETCAALLAVKWWDWPASRISEAADLLSDNDVDVFLAYANTLATST